MERQKKKKKKKKKAYWMKQTILNLWQENGTFIM